MHLVCEYPNKSRHARVAIFGTCHDNQCSRLLLMETVYPCCQGGVGASAWVFEGFCTPWAVVHCPYHYFAASLVSNSALACDGLCAQQLQTVGEPCPLA